MSKKVPQISTVGWTIVPLFTSDGYLLSGMYQIPLIAGEVMKEIVQALVVSQLSSWEFILENINKKKIKWLSTTSIVVRLLDCQREGNLEQAWDFKRIDPRYLPKNNIQKYIYDSNADAKAKQGKILKSLVPRKEDVQTFQQKITSTLSQELNLH